MKVARDSFLTSGIRSGRWRRGSSLLEVQIAFAVLGIGLAGLCPFVVMQLKQLVNLESRFMATSYTINSVPVSPWPPPSFYTTPSFIALGQPAPTGPPYNYSGLPYNYYLVPWNYPWARKLTTRAQLLLLTAGSIPTITTPSVTHVTLPQASPPPPPPPYTSAVGQVSLTLDGNGNATMVTANVQVN